MTDLDPDPRLFSYDYDLPKELITQEPADPRDSARLLVIDRASQNVTHHGVSDLPTLLRPGDLIVANRSRVLRARLFGTKLPSGGRVEITVLRPVDTDSWEALVRGHRIPAGQQVLIEGGAVAVIGEPIPAGRRVSFPGVDVYRLLEQVGRTPLPPYIQEYRGDPERYQTVYADTLGSAAAPTAGLHFTPTLIERLRERGVGWGNVVLHIGLDTFKPLTDEDVRHRHIHTEWVEIPPELVDVVESTRLRGGRVVAVGTSTVRALEFAAVSGSLRPYHGPVDLFIVPGHQFRIVDALMTNFHLPRTSVLILAAAFTGRELLLRAYQAAIARRYRFLSFGDATLIL
ncbi:MAG: tRNA preQ1(34) S-adenosylmethionine ribosyltransferase-isomerase QueA [Chloroflexi bacterium]|nr:tRNA preQ1(34) S-adenosylmethionine ribosyltransferase-isomerase QueA [Chloroflexota bacterium]